MITGSPFLGESYAQQDQGSLVDDVRALEQNRVDLAELKNMTMTEMAILSDISLTSTKLATQGAYTAMSVFFLGISLVIFGLQLTSRGLRGMSTFFTLMIWALTLPVVILIALYQFGVLMGITGLLAESDEPFFILSFFLYIPIGIVIFLLFAQKRIIHRKASKEYEQEANDAISRLDKIAKLKEKGLLSESEFDSLKSDLISQSASDVEQIRKSTGRLAGSEANA